MARFEIDSDPQAVLPALIGRMGGLGPPKAILACTFAFHHEVFHTILRQLCDKLWKLDLNDLRKIPIDVVCDSRMYHGHLAYYNVRPWPGGRLFHPKILLFLYSDCVVWVDGSLNLTLAGWQENREFAFIHSPGALTLPGELRQFLAELAKTSPAAQYIYDRVLKNERGTRFPHQLYTSISEPIFPRFAQRIGTRRLKRVTEIRVMAPFVGAADELIGEAGADQGFLNILKARCPNAVLKAYLPLVGEKPQILQCTQEVLRWLRHTGKAKAYGVPAWEGERKLHGKLLALRIPGSRGDRGYFIVGSPNMTAAALLNSGSKANVEVAWGLSTGWSEIERMFSVLRAPPIDLSKAKAISPRISAKPTWMALEQATYYVLKKKLVVAWSKGYSDLNTELLYSGTAMELRHGCCAPFELKDDRCWIEMRPKGKARKTEHPGRIPIVLQPVDWVGQGSRKGQPTPESLLAMLGALSKAPGNGHDYEDDADDEAMSASGTNTFKLSEQVRDLSDKIRFTRTWLREDSAPFDEWARRVDLLQVIFEIHNPNSRGITDQERVWRFWVRFDFWRLFRALSRGSGIREIRRRHHLSLFARRWKSNLVLPIASTKKTMQDMLDLEYRI